MIPLFTIEIYLQDKHITDTNVVHTSIYSVFFPPNITSVQWIVKFKHALEERNDNKLCEVVDGKCYQLLEIKKD